MPSNHSTILLHRESGSSSRPGAGFFRGRLGIATPGQMPREITTPNGPLDALLMESGPLRRAKFAILALDVVDYSLHIERDDWATVCRLRNLYHNVIAPAAAANRGRIVRIVGDGALVVFGDATSAVRCAFAIQSDVCRSESILEPALQLRLRAGIDTGETIAMDGDIHGRSVIIAARLEALANPGEIWLTRRTYIEAENDIKVLCDDLGERRVRHIKRPVRVYRISRQSLPANH